MCAESPPLFVLCPDGKVGKPLRDLPPPPEAFGPDGYPMPPDSTWLAVWHSEAHTSHWPADACKFFPGEKAT